MSRGGLERVSEDELIVLVLNLQRPAKTSRTSSKPPSTDREERRGQSRPGGAKPGHEGHSPVIAEDPDTVFDHCPTACSDCGLALSADMQAQTVSVHEQIELPEVKPLVEQHRRLSVVCPGCSARVPALRPTGAVSTPFGPRLHATAAYLKTFQALSYERLHEALFDLFGRRNSQGGPTKMLRRAETRFEAGSDAALSALRRATVGGVRRDRRRIQGTNSSHWVFRGEEAVVHHAAPTRGACVLHEIMDGHRPAVWLSDRYSAQQGHADRQQTCLAHLARDVVDALDVGDDTLALRLKLWVDGAFALARTITRSAPSTAATKRSRLERSLDDILVASAACDPARDIPSRMARARDQLLTFASFPGRVEAHKNACKRDLRLAVIQRKNTNGYRAMWSAKGEAAVRTVVATARMTSGASTFTIVLGTIGV